MSAKWDQTVAASQPNGKGADDVDLESACAFCGDPLYRGHKVTGETLCERHGLAEATIKAADRWGINDAQVIAQQDMPNSLEILGACQEMRKLHWIPTAR